MPVGSPPVENGRLAIDAGRVVAVERANGPLPGELDLGDVAVVPGFVNAHTHLELTACRGQVPYTGSFAGWIQRLITKNPHRSGADAVRRSVEAGLAQSLAAGVTAVADIGSGGVVLEAWRQAPIHVVGFLEVIGLGRRFRELVAADRSVTVAAAMLGDSPDDPASAAPPVPLRRFGITPHAPYTTEAAVYREAMDDCLRAGRPLCTHLSETRDEWRFLADGTGPLRGFLEGLSLWDTSFTAPRCSPVAYAAGLGLLGCRPILAHVNYADDDDLDLLAAGNASVAYCPRTHRFFEHAPHRYADMLARAINVCLGTDSLASNETLSILDELRFLRSIDSRLPDEQLLALGTLAGARALGLEAHIGSLEPGKRADFVVLPLSHPAAPHPLEELLHGRASPSAVFMAGRRVGPGVA